LFFKWIKPAFVHQGVLRYQRKRRQTRKSGSPSRSTSSSPSSRNASLCLRASTKFYRFRT
jgi:hypothetical protein